LPTGATYVIVIDGATYYCLNGRTGAILSTSAAAATVIQYAIDNATNGALVFISAGVYDLGATAITISEQRQIHLMGEGNDIAGTKLTVLKGSVTGGLIKISGAVRLQNMKISNLCIMATGAAAAAVDGYGIYLYDSEGTKIYEVTVRDYAVGRGIYVTCSAASYVGYTFITNCFIYNNKYGIYLHGNQVGNEVNCVTMYGMMIIGVGEAVADSTGVFIGHFTNGTYFMAGDIETSYYAFYIEGDNSTIFGARNEAVHSTYYLVAGALKNSIIEPYYSGQTHEWEDAGTGNTIQCHRTPYLSEHWGTSTGTGAEQTIAHGLIAAPTLILVSDYETNAFAYVSSAADAVNIYITAVLGKDYSWCARVG
jgi:hypothetical protein